ncbi:MAG: amidase [Myxococcales bacterium]|nr:amidase [Myxococcales bacterium]
MTYDLAPMKAPRAAGTMLRALVALLENGATGPLLADKLLADAGITKLRALATHEPMAVRHPVFDHAEPRAAPYSEAKGRAALVDLDAELVGLRSRGAVPETAADFTTAYVAGRTTPVAIAERALAIIAESDKLTPKMRCLIAHDADDLLAQARASETRYHQNAALGPLDGVPVAVKDELDQAGYGTTVGTRFLGKSRAICDSEVVMRLRAAGALLIGKANMHELGLGVTGLNPHHGSARNPYAPGHATGGSSSGSAASVALGLSPIAVGADGGGSIRIPAALCGQLGLKPTLGRISEHGAAELCWTVAHIGPIAGTVRDLALAYAAMAGPDTKDPTSLGQPAVRTDGIANDSLAGVRVGIFRPWFEDAEPAIVQACARALEWLEDAGAAVIDIDLPELETMRVAHLISIVTEMATAHLLYDRAHRGEYGLDVRLNLALARHLRGFDYVHAQRHRARVTQHFARALAGVDAIVTPTTGRTAPPLPEDALATGETNLPVVGQIIRFAAAANLTGLPAISVPCGYDDAGLPIGVQLMGRAWEEHRLLHFAALIERRHERTAPAVRFRYLG